MSVEVKELQSNAYLLSYHGKVTVEQLEAGYREILDLENCACVLADGTDMIYSDEILFSETLASLILQKISEESTKAFVLVASEDHPIREPTTQFYDSIGYLHKIHFVDSRDKGIELISDLLKE